MANESTKLTSYCLSFERWNTVYQVLISSSDSDVWFRFRFRLVKCLVLVKLTA